MCQNNAKFSTLKIDFQKCTNYNSKVLQWFCYLSKQGLKPTCTEGRQFFISYLLSKLSNFESRWNAFDHHH